MQETINVQCPVCKTKAKASPTVSHVKCLKCRVYFKVEVTLATEDKK